MQHDTPEYLAALRYELEQAQGGHAGGQRVSDGRIAAIEAQIALVEKSLPPTEVVPEPAPAPKSRRSAKLETADADEELEDTNGPTA